MLLKPRFSFGKIRGVISASFAYSRGVSPSLCTVTINPGVPLDRAPHTMTFSDGYRTISLRDCIISDMSPERGEDGFQSITLSILDRRWRWRFGQVSGVYNLRKAGQIVPSTRKSARELAEICFHALGEKRFDLRAMPNNSFPHVDWDMQRPDAALDEVCKSVNCHVVLRFDDTPAVYRDGFGDELPALPSSSQGEGYDFGVLPGQVGVASAPMMWQLDLPLLPVGLDLDGRIKRIDRLSYRPSEGWANAGDPAYLQGVRTPEGSDKNVVRKLAAKTVYRWYAISLPEGLKKMPTTGIAVKSVRQLLPVLDHQLDVEEFDRADSLLSPSQDLGKVRKPVQVYGLFYDESGIDSNSGEKISRDLKANPRLIYEKSFQIDNDRGLVQFADPVYYLKDGKYRWANLRLRCAVNFYHPETGAAYRLQMRRKLFSAGGAGVDWEAREDIQPEWKRFSQGEQSGDVSENLKDVKAQLGYYLAYAVGKYQTKAPASGSYPMLIPASPDGRIAQVIYSIASSGEISTSVHRDVEGLTNVVPYEDRRKQLAQLAGLQQQQRMANQQDNKRGKK